MRTLTCAQRVSIRMTYGLAMTGFTPAIYLLVAIVLVVVGVLMFAVRKTRAAARAARNTVGSWFSNRNNK